VRDLAPVIEIDDMRNVRQVGHVVDFDHVVSARSN
jgi:hypothetical protein